MVKTTVYIPEDLKDALARTARRRGLAEADVIREALRHEVTDPATPPVFPLFRSGWKDAFAEQEEELLRATGFGLGQR